MDDRRTFRKALRVFIPLVVMLSPAARAEPLFQQTEAWGRDDGRYVSHFVYGIGVTWDDTVLIACEGRVEGADAAEKDLLVKRSTDHGATWSDDQVIEGASDKLSWSNPTFVSDGIATYLFYAQSVSSDIGRVFYRTTKDNGLTWSERVEITHLWADNAHGWTQLSSIGHGIKKLKDPHRGRVLVAFHHRGAVDRPPTERGYGNDVIQLGPNGWEIAGGPPIESARGTNEARLAERADGSLMMIARQAAGNNQLRARSDSKDGGRTWGPWVTQDDIQGTVCDSGLLRFSDAHHLYSYPASTARSAQQRQDLTIAVSGNGGHNWNQRRLLHRGQSTYSDLARDSKGNIYCIYGADGTNFMGERALVARFNLEWVVGKPIATIVIDDTDAEFSTHGTWQEESSQPGRFGSGYRVSQGKAKAAWNPALPAPGDYEIYLRWPARSGASTVDVEVVSSERILGRHQVDQRTDPGAWHFLGTFALDPSGQPLVRISARDGASVLADAVMFQQQ